MRKANINSHGIWGLGTISNRVGHVWVLHLAQRWCCTCTVRAPAQHQFNTHAVQALYTPCESTTTNQKVTAWYPLTPVQHIYSNSGEPQTKRAPGPREIHLLKQAAANCVAGGRSI